MGNKPVNTFNLENIENEGIYLKLDNKAIKYLKNLIQKSNTVLDEKTKNILYRIYNNKKSSLAFIKKISNLLNIPIIFFQEHVILLASAKNTNVGIKNPRFPFKFNTREGAIFISAILGDGEVNNQIQVGYYNKNKKLIMSVLSCAKQIFGDVNYKIYLREDKTYQLHFPRMVGLVMLQLGLEPGYKSVTNYKIPAVIFNLKKEEKAAFIRQFFNDEGNVRLKDRRLQVKQTLTTSFTKERIRSDPEKYTHNFLIGLKQLLSEFEIVSKISLGHYRNEENGVKGDFELSIYGKENIENFRKNINFDINYKKRLLQQAIRSYKFPSAPRNQRLEFALKNAQKVQEKNGFVTKQLLAKECKRSLKTATYYLIDLKKKGLVEIVEKPRRKDGCYEPFKYIIT